MAGQGLEAVSATILGKAARVPLSRVVRLEQAGEVYYRKSRRWYTPGLVFAAERLLKPRFHVLPVRAWRAREAWIFREAYGLEVVSDGEALVMPALPGVSLAGMLASSGEAAWRGLTASIQALRAMHAMPALDLEGRWTPFSHGDATVHNVLYDEAEGVARWYDFETVHDADRATAWRHADDLRAFTMSAAGCLPEPAHPSLVACVNEQYPEPPVLEALREMLRVLQAHPDPFHAAQAGMPARARGRFERLLLAWLGG